MRPSSSSDVDRGLDVQTDPPSLSWGPGELDRRWLSLRARLFETGQTVHMITNNTTGSSNAAASNERQVSSPEASSIARVVLTLSATDAARSNTSPSEIARGHGYTPATRRLLQVARPNGAGQ
jgi:hypothetical protein